MSSHYAFMQQVKVKSPYVCEEYLKQHMLTTVTEDKQSLWLKKEKLQKSEREDRAPRSARMSQKFSLFSRIVWPLSTLTIASRATPKALVKF